METRITKLAQAAEMTDLQLRIQEIVNQHGGIRIAARARKIDHAYLSRLASGEKDNPGDVTLRKLGLRKVIHYVYK